MQTNRWRVALAALVLVGGTGTLWAQQDAARLQAPPLPTRLVGASRPDVLKGLKGIGLLIEDPSDIAKGFGLTKERIQSVTELSLRRNGVQVLTEEESVKTLGGAYLYVDVNVGRAGYGLDVALHERVRLERAPDTLVLGAETWSRGSAGTHTGDAVAADFIVKNVERYVDQFCLDYLKANPK